MAQRQIMTKPLHSPAIKAVLPSAEAAPPQRHRMADVEALTQVVLVEDDPAVREQLAEILKEPGFALHATASAGEFFDALEGFEAQIVLIDLSLPGRDGIDILKQLRDTGFKGDIVLMSGKGRHVLETTRRMAEDYGLAIAGLLQKPFTTEELLAQVDPSSAAHSSGDSRIRAALAAHQIRPYFQPKIDLKTGKIVGAEALSRWHHPERGILMPDGYMKTVRSTGSQSVHDYRILECTLALGAKVNAAGHRLKFAVNFTADDVQGDYFIDVIKDAQARHGIAPDQLIIELTETETVQNFDTLAERLLKLRLYGAEIAIDDFGTGHSSLSRIQRLPVSEIKIDRSFVTGLSEYSDDLAIVRSIIELAHSFGCQIVAEGVETLESLAVLRKLGCDMAQGHLFSPAVNEPTFCALISSEFPAFAALKAVDDEGPPPLKPQSDADAGE
jgi:EAL domain-containing protein (putative c-di-GMP-specific phosphodiesterase class I)/ActR/RegA family two-component response regulator